MSSPSRLAECTPDKTGRADEPSWTREAITWLDNYLKVNPQSFVVEWGSGSSTGWLADRAGRLLSIEHDPEWANRIGGPLSRRPDAWRHSLRRVPLGPAYYRMPQPYCDVAIVDGRLRVFCCERAMEILAPGGILILDDAQRAEYAEVHELLKDWTVVRTTNGIEVDGAPWRTDIWTKPL